MAEPINLKKILDSAWAMGEVFVNLKNGGLEVAVVNMKDFTNFMPILMARREYAILGNDETGKVNNSDLIHPYGTTIAYQVRSKGE